MPLNPSELDRARAALAQHLRALPAECPPPFTLTELKRRAARQRVRRQARLAFAACLALAVVVLVVWREARPELTAASWLSLVLRPSMSEAAHAPRAASRAWPDRRSREIERWLARPPDPEAIVHVSTGLAVADLEDRIASMDDRLNEARLARAPRGELQNLQQQRASLLDSLILVRYADTLASEVP